MYYSATPIHRSGPNKGKSANVPDHPPPPGYICYRCGEKGHWIQVCPTNDDPAYENRPRVKRTTGIPRSFLKTVEKPIALTTDGTMDDAKQPAGIMVNAEGEWVIAEPDKAAWDQYQAKAKVSAAAQEAATQGSKELQARGLECSIDKHLFVDPTKTPCCQTTFCHDCITNALLENDLHCPECSTENILIDDLIPDTEMNAKVRSYETEKATVQVSKEDSKSPVSVHQDGKQSPTPRKPDQPSSPRKPPAVNGNPRKRPAESELKNDRIASAPNEKSSKQSQGDTTKLPSQHQNLTFIPNMPVNQQIPYSNTTYMSPQASNAMMFPGMNNFSQMGMSMDPMLGMNPAFPASMMMPNGSFTGNNWNTWQGGNFQSSLTQNGPYNQHNNFINPTAMNGMTANRLGTNGIGGTGQGRGTFANQQRTTFSPSSTNDEDSAYFRKPVNPHRHQGRRNVQRPTDYREI